MPTLHTDCRAALLGAGTLALVVVLATCSKDSVAPQPQQPQEPPAPQNQLPVANAGADQMASATVAVFLDGSASSDPDQDSLTYQWSFASRPQGSAAAFDSATAVKPRFVPDLAGAYVVRLVVSDGKAQSSPDDATITAEDRTGKAMVGPAGGEVISRDSVVTLDVPSGALPQDTEIRITLVPRSQYGVQLEDLDTSAVVYDFQPHGLQFSQPAQVTFRLKDTLRRAGDTLGVTPRFLVSVSDTVAELPDSQLTEIDADGGGQTISAQVTHFSAIIQPILEYTTSTGQSRGIIVGGYGVPAEMLLGESFEPVLLVSSSFGTTLPEDLEARQVDLSDPPVLPAPGFDGSFAARPGREDEVESKNVYHCGPPAGNGVYRVQVELKFAPRALVKTVYGKSTLEYRSSSGQFFRYRLQQEVKCIPPDLNFLPFSQTDAEAATKLGSGVSSETRLIAVAGKGGGTVATEDGKPVAKLTGLTDQVYSNGVIGAAGGGLVASALVYTSGGIYQTKDALPTKPADPVPEVALSKANFSVPGVTTNTRNTTDGVPFNNDPDAKGVVFTQFDDRNVLVVVPGSNDFIVDPNVAGAFYNDQGKSVFEAAGTWPVSAFAGPNGFTEQDPMLVVAIVANASPKLFRVDLVGGKAVLTEITEVAPLDGPRKLRCLEGICVVSRWGSSLGFGGLTFFKWDGKSQITPLAGRLGWRPVGVDLIRDGSRLLVATTHFATNEYVIDELTAAGEYVAFNSYPVPAGCEGPGHVLFHSAQDVIITCYTSGNVVAAKVSP